MIVQSRRVFREKRKDGQVITFLEVRMDPALVGSSTSPEGVKVVEMIEMKGYEPGTGSLQVTSVSAKEGVRRINHYVRDTEHWDEESGAPDGPAPLKDPRDPTFPGPFKG